MDILTPHFLLKPSPNLCNALSHISRTFAYQTDVFGGEHLSDTKTAPGFLEAPHAGLQLQ